MQRHRPYYFLGHVDVNEYAGKLVYSFASFIFCYSTQTKRMLPMMISSCCLGFQSSQSFRSVTKLRNKTPYRLIPFTYKPKQSGGAKRRLVRYNLYKNL